MRNGWSETVRVWLAGLFVFAGILLFACLLGSAMEHGSAVTAVLLGLALGLLACILGLVALVLFNLPLTKSGPPVDHERQLRAWEELGLLITADFHATRAFRITWESTDEDVEDEQWFFLELEDKSVLYLVGDYFYDMVYDEEEDYEEDGERQARLFPCTDFTIKRYSPANWAVDLHCRGQVIQFETLDLSLEDTWVGPNYRDGDILTDQTYDERKNTLIERYSREENA